MYVVLILTIFQQLIQWMYVLMCPCAHSLAASGGKQVRGTMRWWSGCLQSGTWRLACIGIPSVISGISVWKINCRGLGGCHIL